MNTIHFSVHPDRKRKREGKTPAKGKCFVLSFYLVCCPYEHLRRMTGQGGT
jgi:hypothetical protein